MTQRAEWYFLSDLHLDETPRQRDLDVALPDFLEALAQCTPQGTTLVLLGDSMELSGPVRLPDARVRERLRAVIDAHPGVKRALSSWVGTGRVLHVVGGNHDIEITRPAVSPTLTSLLTGEAVHARVRFTPWALHERGAFHAEHGNQHHDLNRLPTILQVGHGQDRTELPVPPLGAVSESHDWCTADGPRVFRLSRALAAARHQERAAASPGYLALLRAEEARLGVPTGTLTEAARLAQRSPTSSLFRAAARLVLRRLRGEIPGGYLLSGARGAHKALVRQGAGVPYYVFGHSHRAAELELPGPPRAVYLNTGTWGDTIRGAGPDRDDPRLFPYVGIVRDGSVVRGGLGYWDSRGRAVTVPHVTR